MPAPFVQVTDSSGRTTGLAGMLDAFADQLIRRTVYIMLVAIDGKYLLQKRSSTVPNYPGYWDASAGGHVDEGEQPDDAAYRELMEELGLQAVDLTSRGSFYFESPVESGRRYKYYAHLYTGYLPVDSQLILDRSEVSSAKLYSRQEIARLAKVTPITRRLLEEL